jgi:hypothetical protein
LAQSLYLDCFIVYLGTALICQIHIQENQWLLTCFVDYATSATNIIVQIPCRHNILLVSWLVFLFKRKVSSVGKRRIKLDWCSPQMTVTNQFSSGIGIFCRISYSDFFHFKICLLSFVSLELHHLWSILFLSSPKFLIEHNA